MEEKVQLNDRELASAFLVHLSKWKNPSTIVNHLFVACGSQLVNAVFLIAVLDVKIEEVIIRKSN